MIRNKVRCWPSSLLSFFLFLIVAGSSLLHELFSSCCELGLLSSCSAQASYCSVFCCSAWALGRSASATEAGGLSSCGSQAVRIGASRCGTWALLLLGMQNLPRSGIEPVSPALAGSFFTTEPPEKPGSYHFYSVLYWRIQLGK